MRPFPLSRRLHGFFLTTSVRICLSSVRSATRRFSPVLSSRSCFNSRSSETPICAYFLVQTQVAQFPIRTARASKPSRPVNFGRFSLMRFRNAKMCSGVGIADNAAEKIHFDAHVGQNLTQGSFHLLTHRGSFHRHRLGAAVAFVGGHFLRYDDTSYFRRGVHAEEKSGAHARRQARPSGG